MADEFARIRQFMADTERRLSRLEAAQSEPYTVDGTFAPLRTFTPGTSDVERVVATLLRDLIRKQTIR